MWLHCRVNKRNTWLSWHFSHSFIPSKKWLLLFIARILTRLAWAPKLQTMTLHVTLESQWWTDVRKWQRLLCKMRTSRLLAEESLCLFDPSTSSRGTDATQRLSWLVTRLYIWSETALLYTSSQYLSICSLYLCDSLFRFLSPFVVINRSVRQPLMFLVWYWPHYHWWM